MWTPENLERAPAILAGLVIIGASLVVAWLVRRLLRRATRSLVDDARLTGVVVSVPFYLVLLIGVLSGLALMGVAIGPALAGLGLGGFALGLALRDVLSNLVSGVMILLYRPFAPGDSITVSGYSGKVLEINLRYTLLEGNAERFLIPNATLLSSPIKLRTPPPPAA